MCRSGNEERKMARVCSGDEDGEEESIGGGGGGFL